MVYISSFNNYESNYTKLLKNKSFIVFRGLNPSGINFYNGETPLPYTYYALKKEKASHYGIVNEYMFNENNKELKIFKRNMLIDIFGPFVNKEDKKVIEYMVTEEYDVMVSNGELMVYNSDLIRKLE